MWRDSGEILENKLFYYFNLIIVLYESLYYGLEEVRVSQIIWINNEQICCSYICIFCKFEFDFSDIFRNFSIF